MNESLAHVLERLKSYDGRKVKIMEVCGTHTSSIFKNGIRGLISPKIELISGPGCPVCVTSSSYVDQLLEYAYEKNTCILTFGDMMKVKGTKESLTQSIARGGKVQILYSPLAAITLAQDNPFINYIFAAVGFETTVPIYGLLLEEITKNKIQNLKLITSMKKIIPALELICRQEKQIDGFLCPGHVSVITGSDCFLALAKKYQKPFVVAGFEAEHIFVAIDEVMNQLLEKRAEVVNHYTNAVTSEGNRKAQVLMEKYFTVSNDYWRGIGMIPESALVIRKEFKQFDGGKKITVIEEKLPKGCKCAQVIMGRIHPNQCPLFGEKCTPQDAIGPCMVSSEGVCGIWYKNREMEI